MTTLLPPPAPPDHRATSVAPPETADAGCAGRGSVRFERVAGRTAVTRLASRSPMKLLAPRAATGVGRVFVSSFGGGLVAGDTLNLDLTAGPGTRVLLSTQASTKVYRSPGGRPATQRATMRVEDDAVLVALPDPVTCFEDAVYEQVQRVETAANATLVLVDWMTAGRTASGERWAFTRYRSHTEIERAGRTLVVEGLWLDRAHGPIDDPFRMGRFNCIAVAYLIGDALMDDVAQLDADMAREPFERRAPLVTVASRVAGGMVLRVAGESTEAVAGVLRRRLDFVERLLGESPWTRKW